MQRSWPAIDLLAESRGLLGFPHRRHVHRHHDNAYRWVERRKLETHPKTGAAQFVEVRQRVEEVVVQRFVEREVATATEATNKPLLFLSDPDDELLSYGVPPDWLGAVREADEDTLLDIVDHLPKEASEALLELATGGKPKPAAPAPAGANPFAHPDAMRRFRVMTDVEALRQALDFPWDKWTIFLHPAQRQIVEREYFGPARVSGSAGTGTTIVALHRAVYLARKATDSRVLLATFSQTLANALHDRLRRLISSEPRLGERLEVGALSAIGTRLFGQQFGAVESTGIGYRVLDDHMTMTTGNICVCTMHLAKGLEFRAVAVMACDDQILPSQPRTEAITDEAELAEVYATERHLLYVAITRARDHLLVTSGGPASEFMDDLKQ